MFKKNLLIPPCMVPGDSIGVAAPASPPDRESIGKGISVLESMGFQIKISDDMFQTDRYLAGSDAHRAHTVNRLFADNDIAGIICARGGYGSIRILPFLDFELIRSHPKIFMGFSDISTLLNVFYERCGLVTYHGPMLSTLASSTLQTQHAVSSLFLSHTSIEIRAQSGVMIHKGMASGPVMGGNLTTLCHLLGTPYAPNPDGHILFLEDKGESCYRIDRMLTQMKLAGWFDRAAGLVLGSFEGCGEFTEILRVVEEILQDYAIPAAAGFDIGHAPANMPIPIGLEAEFDADRQMLMIQ